LSIIKVKPVILLVLLVTALMLTGCSASVITTYTTAFKTSDIVGAGATFPYPLYAKWFNAYYEATGVKVNYQAVGSGAGINQITNGTVDFGASDAIMTNIQQSQAEAAYGPLLHIPTTLGAVTVIYNLPGIKSLQLKLNGEVLANICLKKINKWNDPSIIALNPGLTLPDQPIAVVHRADSSGTTYIFTNYLTKVSSDWQTRIGFGTSVSWPGDIGADQSAGVTGQVLKQPYSIGYVELAYAIENKVSYAVVQNEAGNFITPSIESTNKAAEGIILPDDMRVMITNSPNPEAYPIAGFTWVLVNVNQRDKAKGEAVVKVLWWAVHDGQQYNEPLLYGKLSPEVVKKVENELLSINYKGQPLFTPP